MPGRWKNLKTREILREINDEDIMEFLVQYARKNQDFLYMLVARFAPRIQSLDESEKYEFLFYKSLNHHLPARQNPTRAKMQNVRSIYDRLTAHARDLVSLEQYAEAFEIIRFGIIYTKLLVKRVRDTIHYPTGLESYLDFHKLLGQLINRSIPPPLVDKIRDYAITESLVYDYIAPDEEFNLYNIALRLTYDETVAMEYMRKVREKLEETSSPGADQNIVKNNLVLSALKWKNFNQLVGWAQDKFIHQDEWEQYLSSGIARGRREEVIILSDQLLPGLSPIFQQRILMAILQSFSGASDDEQMLSFANRLLEISKDINSLYSIIENGKFKPKQKKILERSIESALEKWNDEKQKIEWLLINRKYPEIVATLGELSDVSTIIKYVSRLPESFHAEPLEILKDKADEILSTSFGPTSAVKIQNMINELRKNDLYRLAEGMLDHIEDNYPKRKSLKSIR